MSVTINVCVYINLSIDLAKSDSQPLAFVLDFHLSDLALKRSLPSFSYAHNISIVNSSHNI